MAGLTAAIARRTRELEHHWYGRSALSDALLPLSWLFRALVALRRAYYRWRNRARPRLPASVIVIGNISVGGTGKTPLVIWLAELLKSHGYKPGIVSRGYGGSAATWPQFVDGESDPYQVGDEPVVIAQRTACPVIVAPDRVNAACALLNRYRCDVLISDDGLQHYPLLRDIEIVVIDGSRGLGNGRCLPAGPLREPPSRLREVDFVIVQGGATAAAQYPMTLHADEAVSLLDSDLRRSLGSFAGERLHAVAGIGNPARFFDMLSARGLEVEAHKFADHHRFTARDLGFDDARPVLMTEKDAVKCRSFAQPYHWYLPVAVRLDDRFARTVLDLLRARARSDVTQRTMELN